MSMQVIHVTDASSAGVLASVTALARAQSEHPAFAPPRLCIVPRPDTPDDAEIQAMLGPRAQLERWSLRLPAGLQQLPGIGRLAAQAAVAAALGAGLQELLRPQPEAIIHLHSTRTGLIGRALALLHRRRSDVVYSPHCFSFARTDLPTTVRRLCALLERAAAAGGAGLILCSDSEAASAADQLPGVPQAILRNSVAAPARGASAPPDVADRADAADPADASGLAGPAAAPDIADPAGASGAVRRVVHIGRIASQKRPELFSAVAAACRDRSPRPIEFRWIGAGEHTRLGPDVHVTGWLPPHAVAAQLEAADLVLFTSAGEGLPMALLQAQAHGLPVIAPPVPGVTDLVDAETGVLASDTAGLTDAVLDLLADPPRAAGLGAAAAARIRRRHSLDDLADRAAAAYQQLLVHRPSSPHLRTVRGLRARPAASRSTRRPSDEHHPQGMRAP